MKIRVMTFNIFVMQNLLCIQAIITLLYQR